MRAEMSFVVATALLGGCSTSTKDVGDAADTENHGTTSADASAPEDSDLSTSVTTAPDPADASSIDDGVEDDEAGDESGDSAGGLPPPGTSRPCSVEGIQLIDVMIEFTTNRMWGADLPVDYDRSMQSWACVDVTDAWVWIRLQHGPPAFGEPGNALSLRLYEGARVYDLATDPGPPGTGNPGAIQLGYSVPFEPAATAAFDTINQAAHGTVDVVALPIGGEIELDISAVGEIAGPNGWEFDFHVTATLPPRR